MYFCAITTKLHTCLLYSSQYDIIHKDKQLLSASNKLAHHKEDDYVTIKDQSTPANELDIFSEQSMMTDTHGYAVVDMKDVRIVCTVCCRNVVVT